MVGLVHQAQFIREGSIFCSTPDNFLLHPLLQFCHITDMQKTVIVTYHRLMQQFFVFQVSQQDSVLPALCVVAMLDDSKQIIEFIVVLEIIV